MDMVLLDWTRMVKTYCLAGVIQHNGQLRIVRPLPLSRRAVNLRNVGWSPHLLAWATRDSPVSRPVVWTAVGAGLQWGAALFDAM